MRYTHILWDWNGTLLDDAWLSVEVINQLLRQRHLPLLSLSRYAEEFTFPVKDYYRRIGFDFTRDSFEDVLAPAFVTGYEARRHECHLQPGARDALRMLAASGVTQTILSAYQQRRLHEMVAFTGIAHFFTHMAGLDDYYAHSKIARGQQLLAELATPREVLLIGDTVHDYEVAHALNVACVLVPSGHQSPTRLAACGVTVLPSLAALLPMWQSEAFGNLTHL